MKKFVFLFLFANIILMWCGTAYSAEIFTAPIDSRPVSVEYLKNLAEVSGDGFVCVTKDSLDFFSGKGEGDHIGDSSQVRSQIYDLASKNNTNESTFIINMTSYLTGGLVGSRSGVNYGELKEAVYEVEKLMRDFPEPHYYINISMPRTLPDSRFGSIWTDDRIYEGLGSFYLKENPQNPDAGTIAAKFAHVSAAQLLLEWAYVKNHEAMTGDIYKWEKDFLTSFEKNFAAKDPYRKYLNNYRSPYLSIAEIGRRLMDLQEEGLDFELIISEDDFSLPDFIVFLNDERLINNRIKYSFALNYMENRLYTTAESVYGSFELEKALNGRGDKINFIFGTDEVPQLIYARDLSKRKGLIPSLFLKNSRLTEDTAAFDVKDPESLYKSAVNFVSVAGRRTVSKTDMFIFDYSVNRDFNGFIRSMKNSFASGADVALTELYTTEQTSKGENFLFKRLADMSKNGNDFGLHSLTAYSSWNTVANAIGLGVASAAVNTINKDINNSKAYARARAKVLMTHAVEDGVYNCDIKRQLYGYYPYYDENNREKLKGLIDEAEIEKAFENKQYDTAEGTFIIKSAEIIDCSFPWERTFECYPEVEIE